MSTIYWIETFTSICAAFFALTFVLFVWGMIMIVDGMEGDRDGDISYGKKLLITSVFFLIAFIFMPSTSTGYKILGIGGTIDYIKNNDTAKQLPDKCIKALDMLLEKQMGKIEKDSIK